MTELLSSVMEWGLSVPALATELWCDDAVLQDCSEGAKAIIRGANQSGIERAVWMFRVA